MTTASPLAVGMDEYQEVAYLVTATGVQFVPMNGEDVIYLVEGETARHKHDGIHLPYE